MIICRPVRTARITQKVGENKTCARVNSDGSFVTPYQTIPRLGGSCPSGYDSLYKNYKGHTGTDFATYYKEPIYFNFLDSGVTWEAKPTWSSSGGHGVFVRSLEPVSFDALPKLCGGSLRMVERQYQKLGGKLYIMVYYGHLHSVGVRDGDTVTAGTFLGYADSTGASTGHHVHYSERISDISNPFFWLDGDNGYAGVHDFSQWYEDVYILDALSEKRRAAFAIQQAKNIIKKARATLHARRINNNI